MKHIIFYCSLLSSGSLFSMESPKLIIKNITDKQITISYKKALPGRVQCKQEKLLSKHTAEISLPATHGLHIRVSGYQDQRIFVPEYQIPILVSSYESDIVISQGERTLGIMKLMKANKK
jgi:hypothetical protein